MQVAKDFDGGWWGRVVWAVWARAAVKDAEQYMQRATQLGKAVRRSEGCGAALQGMQSHTTSPRMACAESIPRTPSTMECPTLQL